MTELKAPFPWFGGKRRVSKTVWGAVGNVDNYVEPFAGSLAVLLGRPEQVEVTRRVETVNDYDGFIANFWRAVKSDPESVAFYANSPVNEIDLIARHLWLVNRGDEWFRNQLEVDPEWFDPKIAGWWVWGICSWIGSGWCSGRGPWVIEEGVVRKRPHLGNAGRGVNRQRPHLGDAGQGVNRQLPHLGDAGQGILSYMNELSNRLRNVRVCCGDWSRVVTKGATNYGKSVGVFLDPPYLGEVRTSDLYRVDDETISNKVRAWCLSMESDPRYRIVLAGYVDEHDHLMPQTWERVSYKATSAYSTTKAAQRQSGNHQNRKKEMLWLSPSCSEEP